MRSTILRHCRLPRLFAVFVAALILGSAASTPAGTPGGGVDGTATEVYQGLPAGFTVDGGKIGIARIRSSVSMSSRP